MFRPAATRTLLLRPTSTTATARTLLLRKPTANRLLSTSATSEKRSTLKGTLARWALTGGIIYWYSTSSVFADEPKFQEELPPAPSEEETDRPASLLPTKPLRLQRSADTEIPVEDEVISSSGAGDLEAEAGQEGAFNPETGEINWDCPCLGGMAHGPCGEEFKAAFSCFVFSTEEPKGVDCIEKFKGMQSCFQKHPEVYGSELDGDDDDEDLDTPPPATEDDTPLAAASSASGAAQVDRSPSLEASSSSTGSAAATGKALASRGAAPAARGSASASRGGDVDPAVTEAKTTPSLAEPSRSNPDTPVLMKAHRGDAPARSVSDAPSEKEREIAAEDAPRRRV